MTDTNEYPHWKSALFGNGHVANLWCAIKYGAWHLTHALFAIAAVLMFIPMHILGVVSRVGQGGIVDRVIDYIPLKTISYIGSILVLAFGAIGVVIGLTLLVLIVINNPVGVGLISLYVGTIIFIAYLTIEYGVIDWIASVMGKSKDTPGLRRVYGHCPVSMGMYPIWFENMLDRLYVRGDE